MTPQENLPKTNYESFEVAPLTPHIGAEVKGIDLSAQLTNSQIRDLRQAWLDHMVLVFRDQQLTREQHKAFGRIFGKLHVHPVNHSRGGDEEVLVVKTTKDSPYTAGDGWHTDVSCEEIPPMGSMLYITEMPASGGGDTMYADMYRAYDMLSDTMKEFLSGLTAIHDGALPYIGAYGIGAPEGQSYPKNEHPVIATHPETGRKLLYVNSGFTTRIKGLAPAESRAILDMLFKHIAETPSLTCRVRWEENTLTFWDNRCTQHHAVWDYYPHSRYGERVSVLGDQRPAA
ncbi:MAG: taurine dioxygenase [Alphaproteobacteria bacterium]|nr:MAG: taurine dioxygenase [Alphaproteobacteria bacterium]